jgi:hypothetical protein
VSNHARRRPTLRDRLPMTLDEANEVLVAAGMEPVPTDLTPAEALTMLIEETGLSRAELERLTGRRFRVPEDGETAR